ncbi:hypothetical protein D3C75_822860 [compost metagenome]
MDEGEVCHPAAKVLIKPFVLIPVRFPELAELTVTVLWISPANPVNQLVHMQKDIGKIRLRIPSLPHLITPEEIPPALRSGHMPVSRPVALEWDKQRRRPLFSGQFPGTCYELTLRRRHRFRLLFHIPELNLHRVL